MYHLLSCVTEDGKVINGNDAARLFALPKTNPDLSAILSTTQERNSEYYNDEIDKLDKWSEDLKLSLEKEIKDLGVEITLKKNLSRKTLNLSTKVVLQRLKEETQITELFTILLGVDLNGTKIRTDLDRKR